jgi:hypothetical protein
MQGENARAPFMEDLVHPQLTEFSEERELILYLIQLRSLINSNLDFALHWMVSSFLFTRTHYTTIAHAARLIYLSSLFCFFSPPFLLGYETRCSGSAEAISYPPRGGGNAQAERDGSVG